MGTMSESYFTHTDRQETQLHANRHRQQIHIAHPTANQQISSTNTQYTRQWTSCISFHFASKLASCKDIPPIREWRFQYCYINLIRNRVHENTSACQAPQNFPKTILSNCLYMCRTPVFSHSESVNVLLSVNYSITLGFTPGLWEAWCYTTLITASPWGSPQACGKHGAIPL